MKTDGQEFLDELSRFPARSFEGNFVRIVTRLGLDGALDKSDLCLLFRAVFLAALCNLAFNGLSGCDGVLKLETEPYRTNVEKDFMAARDDFFDTVGWQSLPVAQRRTVQKTCLNVLVRDENLAW